MIVSFISYKGGVGKSCMSRNLAVYLAHDGYKVCIVDTDESQATSKWSGRRVGGELEPYVHVVGVMDAKALRSTVKHQYQDNDYDILVIDSPPSDQVISRKIMSTSNLILIPITPTGNDELDSIAEMLERYGEIQEDQPVPAYFIINRYDQRVAFHKSFIAQLTEMGKEYNVSILEPYICYRPAIYGEISTFGQGVTEHKDKKAKVEFSKLAARIINIGEKI